MSLVCYLAHSYNGTPDERRDNIRNALAWLQWLVDHTAFAVCVPWLPYVQQLEESAYRLSIETGSSTS